MYRRIGGSVVHMCLLVAIVIAAGCDDQPVNIPTDTMANFAEGRSFATRARISTSTDALLLESDDAGGNWIDRRVTVSTSDPVWVSLYDIIKNERCRTVQWRRHDRDPQHAVAAHPGFNCSGWAVYGQAIDTCVGYAFQTLAESTTATVVHSDGRLEPESTDSTVNEEPTTQGSPVMRIPAPSASDAATLSLVATTAFQYPAMEGAYEM